MLVLLLLEAPRLPPRQVRFLEPPRLKGPSQPILLPHSGSEAMLPRGGIIIREGHAARPLSTWPMFGKGKGKAVLGFAPALPEVDSPSPHYMESLMPNSHLFEESLLQDLDKEVVSDLASEFGAPMIKKVLDLLRESTPFQMVVAVTFYLWSC